MDVWPPQPRLMDVWPPGGACKRVDERSVMTLPQFWFAPLAYALLEPCERLAFTPNAIAGSLRLRIISCADVSNRGSCEWRGGGALSSPKLIDVWPPGGACKRVDERSVMTLPQFWFAPLAYALLEPCERLAFAPNDIS